MDKFTEELMGQVARELEMDPELVHKIVSFQFKDIMRAAYNYKQLEMTWFGKWYASNHKCQKRLFKLRDMEACINERLNGEEEFTELRLSSYNAKLRKIREQIDFLRSKIEYEVRLKGADGRYLERPVREATGGGGRREETTDLPGLLPQLGASEEVQSL